MDPLRLTGNYLRHEFFFSKSALLVNEKFSECAVEENNSLKIPDCTAACLILAHIKNVSGHVLLSAMMSRRFDTFFLAGLQCVFS